MAVLFERTHIDWSVYPVGSSSVGLLLSNMIRSSSEATPDGFVTRLSNQALSCTCRIKVSAPNPINALNVLKYLEINVQYNGLIIRFVDLIRRR
jgi:hypothetical protein